MEVIILQLDKLVNYYKALGDRNRIRILILISNKEMNGLTLAEKLGVTPGTITHHIAKLKEVGIVVERRDKNMSYYSLSHYLIEQTEGALIKLIEQHKYAEDDVKNESTDKNEKFRESVLKSFITVDDRLKQIPAQLKKKLIVMEFIVRNLEVGLKYTEKEINEFIKIYHPDFATIRREFIMHHYLYRENDIYELNPREMWAKWEQL
jgi:biotin operon repressor